MQIKDKKAAQQKPSAASAGQKTQASGQASPTPGASRAARTGKQIAALLCVGLLVFLYILTLVAALLDFPHSDRLFAGCLVATVGLPILLWIYLWLYQKVTERREEGKGQS